MTEAAILDFGLARLTHLEQRVLEGEHVGLRARWEFGAALLAARDGKGKLPPGYLAEITDEVGTPTREIQRRMRFAERYPDDDRLRHAMTQYGSWFAVVNDGLSDVNDSEPPAAGVLPPLPENVFRVVVADPPWRYGNTSTRGAAEDHYPTMTLDELAALPVEERSADEAHLYLWTTNGFLREAFDLIDAWGYTYKTCLTWVKPQMGMGNYFRSSTEHVLFGVRGGLRTQQRNLMNWFEAPRGKHSAKPASFYDLVEVASPGPYLEMFARRRRLGWESWGNEV